MIETAFFLFGLCFSILVYFRSFKQWNAPFLKKAFYFSITLIGITGTLLLFGAMASNLVDKMHEHTEANTIHSMKR